MNASLFRDLWVRVIFFGSSNEEVRTIFFIILLDKITSPQLPYFGQKTGILLNNLLMHSSLTNQKPPDILSSIYNSSTNGGNEMFVLCDKCHDGVLSIFNCRITCHLCRCK